VPTVDGIFAQSRWPVEKMAATPPPVAKTREGEGAVQCGAPESVLGWRWWPNVPPSAAAPAMPAQRGRREARESFPRLGARAVAAAAGARAPTAT
jgi:hypothetical protein